MQDPYLRRKPRIWPWALLAAVVLAVAALAVYRLSLRHQIANELAALSRQGYPTSLRQLQDWPEPAPAETNAADGILEAANAAVVDNGVLADLPWPTRTEELGPKERDDFHELLTNNAPALHLLHSSLQLGKCRYPIAYERGPDALLPHLAKLKSLTSLLRAEALLSAEEGQPEQAVQAVTDGVRVAQSLDSEPLLISQLVRLAILNTTCSSLERVLSQQSLSDAQLQKLYQAFTAAEQAYAAARVGALAGETCLGVQFFTVTVGQLAHYLDPQTLGTPGGSQTGFTEAPALTVYTCTGLKDRDFLCYLRTMRQFLDAAKQPYPDALTNARAVARNFEQTIQKDRLLVISRMLVPSLEKSQEKHADIEGRLRAAIASLAVERYRARHNGSVPDSLQSLVPEFLAAVPADPIDGAPLRFVKLTPGYVIYSIGPDGRDDGGVEHVPRANSRPRKNKKSSISPPVVARVPGSSTEFDTTFIVER